MLKQHCEICDRVIPSTEAYRTVNFGRGTNSNVNTGYSPMVICKKCWKIMYAAVKPDTDETDMVSANSPLGNILSDIINDDDKKRANEKGCKDCKHCFGDINSDPCASCVGCDKWEANNDEN